LIAVHISCLIQKIVPIFLTSIGVYRRTGYNIMATTDSSS